MFVQPRPRTLIFCMIFWCLQSLLTSWHPKECNILWILVHWITTKESEGQNLKHFLKCRGKRSWFPHLNHWGSKSPRSSTWKLNIARNHMRGRIWIWTPDKLTLLAEPRGCSLWLAWRWWVRIVTHDAVRSFSQCSKIEKKKKVDKSLSTKKLENRRGGGSEGFGGLPVMGTSG